jgi:four helix bundle protein
MMKENVLLEKCIAFAVRVINAYKYLTEEKREFIISKQYLQCGTDIGAHVESSIGGTSKTDFLFEMTNAYKKARKTKYWIIILQTTDFFAEAQAKSLLADVEEILRIIGKTQVTTKNSLPDS